MDSQETNPLRTKEQDYRALVVELSQQLTWNRKEAAIMCGISPSKFSEWVREGFMPQPLRNGRFSADAIRRRLSAGSGGPNPKTPYDHWRAAS